MYEYPLIPQLLHNGSDVGVGGGVDVCVGVGVGEFGTQGPKNEFNICEVQVPIPALIHSYVPITCTG
jgi:hypothetical protein